MKDPSPVNVLSAVLALQEMMTADAAPSVLYAALLRSLMTLSSSASALITELAQDAPEGRQMTITASCTAAEQPVTELELPELSSLAEKASACENAALSLSAHGGKPCCGNDRINHLLVLPLLYNKQPLASVFLFNREQAYDTGLIASLAPLTQLGAIIAGLLSMQRKHILIERALRDSEVRLRQVIDLVPHHIFAIVPSKGGRLIFANKALAEVYGMTTEEVVGKTQREITPMRAEEEHFLADDLEVIRSGKEKFIPEEIYTDPFGRVHYLQTTKIPFKAVDTGEPAVLGICVDITEQKKAAEERRHIEEQLQQSQKLESLGLLAGGIAHDFNNLLTGILGHASLALLDIPQASPAHARLRSVETAAHRAAQLCRQLLAYSGRGNFEIKPLNLSAIVGEMAEFLTVSVSKKAELRLELAPVLPAVDGDASQLHQVILNLLI
ncbi:MAG TPA: PAS domain S-box protein, partial [Oligoflexia bacterium]|nr:PAS domain S-box protein [Oligoflexia bacterium]